MPYFELQKIYLRVLNCVLRKYFAFNCTFLMSNMVFLYVYYLVDGCILYAGKARFNPRVRPQSQLVVNINSHKLSVRPNFSK